MWWEATLGLNALCATPSLAARSPVAVAIARVLRAPSSTQQRLRCKRRSVMEGNVFWTQGVKAANEAVVHDNNKEWKLALENYIKALDYFQSFLKFEQNQQIKDHAKPGIAK